MAIPSKVQEKRQAFTEKIIDDIRSGKPFFWDPGVVFNPPRNLIADLKGEDTRYHGINNMLLSYVASREGFTDNRWATFAQVKSLQKEGVPFEDQPKIQKGAKGYTIEYWQYSKIKMTVDENGKKVPVMKENPETGRLEPEKIPLNPPLVKTYTVFNASQMDNIPPSAKEFTIDESQRNESMEAMLANSEAKIYYDQSSSNFYRIGDDTIHLMPQSQFKGLMAFYGTAAHEIAHSTGAEKRMAREGVTNTDGFGGEIYAKEELRAEMASMFLAQEYGITLDENHYESHIAYLQSWAKAVEKDPDELFRAAAEAQKITDYIKTHMIEKNLEIEKSAEKEEPKEIVKEPVKTKTDEFLEKLSMKITFVEKGTGTDEKIVIGGGNLSYCDYTVADAITREMTPEEEMEKLGGRLYECEKEYSGVELNKLMNDLIKDDATTSLGMGGYNKAYVIITHPDVPVKLSNRWDIGDGCTFDLTKNQNGYTALVDYLEKEAPPFRDAIAALDPDELAQKTAEWEKPDFTRNTDLYKNMLLNLTVGENVSVDLDHSHQYFRDLIEKAEKNQHEDILKDLELKPLDEETRFYKNPQFDSRFKPSYQDIKTTAHLRVLQDLGKPYSDEQKQMIEQEWKSFYSWPLERDYLPRYEYTRNNISQIIKNTTENTIKKTQERDFKPIKRSITIPDKPKKKKTIRRRQNATQKKGMER